MIILYNDDNIILNSSKTGILNIHLANSSEITRCQGSTIAHHQKQVTSNTKMAK